MKDELITLIQSLLDSQYKLSNCVSKEQIVERLFNNAKERFLVNESEARLLKNIAIEFQEMVKLDRKIWEEQRGTNSLIWERIEEMLDETENEQ